MSEICEHDTFKDICVACHRGDTITRLTAEVERLTAELRTAADMNAVYEGRLQEKEAENERLTAVLEDIAYPNPLHNEDDLMRIARTILEEPK
jgi:hypothetical protein